MNRNMDSGVYDDGASIFNETIVNIDLDDENVDLDLTDYAEDEIVHINEVMRKDKSLRSEERERKRKVEESLDQSIMSIEMKNVDSGEKFCLVCGEKFSLFINPRKVCLICEKGACSNCLCKVNNDNTFICKLCYLTCIRDGKTGKWFSSLSKTNGRFRRSATIIIMNSIRRIKAKFMSPTATISDNMPQQVPEPIKAIGNGGINQPLYLTKKNSPKPPRKMHIEKEAVSIPSKASESITVTYDSVDAREMEVASLKSRIEDLPSVNIDQVYYDGDNRSSLKALSHSNEDLLSVQTDHVSVHDDHESNLKAMSSLSSSAYSVYSETFESYNSGIPVSGEILFAVYYFEPSKLLSITVDQCRNIAVADRKKLRTDPYIKTYLLPDRTKVSKMKTATKKATVNPVYKETLTYTIDANDLVYRTLSVSVWHHSPLRYNLFLGEVQLVLTELDLTNKDPQWHTFTEKRKYPIRSAGLLFKGEIMIKLKYMASSRKEAKGELQVFVIGAKNLETDRSMVNSYVKGYLLPNKDPKSKQKTSVVKHTLNPKWNSMLQFKDVCLEDLNNRSLELSIYHQNRLKVNEFLGGVRLNLGLGLYNSDHVQWMDAQGAEKEAWERFLETPNENAEVTLNLRPNLDY